MGLTDGVAREGIPEEIEDELTRVEEQAYSLAKMLRLYGLEVSEAPVYTAMDEIRDAIVAQAQEEVSTDPLNRSYFETGYGSAARITQAELVIIPSAGSPSRYPLDAITDLHRTPLPAGQTAVMIVIRDGESAPGLTFSDAYNAAAFTTALREARDGACDEGGIDTPEADALANHEARKRHPAEED